eukprot:363611-Chlamydomonas_euryale.AAC.18
MLIERIRCGVTIFAAVLLWRMKSRTGQIPTVLLWLVETRRERAGGDEERKGSGVGAGGQRARGEARRRGGAGRGK